jgi:hypothetical protein
MTNRDPEAQRQYQREYRARNRERKNAQQRASYARNRDKRLAYMREYNARNRETVLQRQSTWRAANPSYQRDWYQRNRETVRINGIRRRHGLRPEDWTALWDAQGGRCYLCGDELAAGKTDVEHDHACCPQGASCPACRRGLACRYCNSLIGYANEDPVRLRRIADALEAAQALVQQWQAASAHEPLF